MLNFPKAQKVKPGQPTSHYHHNSLANAFNQKILSGVGDCSWRIFYYALSMFRNVRNPQDTNYPAQDEWFKFYSHLEPKMTYGRFGWPETMAGEEEGANVGNPFLAWIFGNNSKAKLSNGLSDDTKDRIHGYWSEPVRLSRLEIDKPFNGIPTKTSGDPNLNVSWYDSEYQRGCCTFISNYRYLPTGSTAVAQKELQLVSLGIAAAARRHLNYVIQATSMGNYAPSYVPDVNGKGGVFRKKNAVKDQIQQALFYYLSFFRGTEDQRSRHNLSGRDVTVDGFDFETFFSKQFLLAPNYSEPRFETDSSGNIQYDILGNPKIKYDNIGYPELVPVASSFSWVAPLGNSVSSNVVRTQKSDTFMFRDGNGNKEFNTNPNPARDQNRFCLSAIFIQTSDIASRTQSDAQDLLDGLYIDIYLNQDGKPKLYESIPITRQDRYDINNRTAAINNRNISSSAQYQLYQFNKVHYFVYPVKGKVSFRVRGSRNVVAPSPDQFGDLSLGLKVSDVDPSSNQYNLSNFSIFIKFAHVVEMKPTVADAYVMMRVATTEGQGSDAGQMDPVGHFNSTTAKQVFNNYINTGVAYTLNKGSTLYENDTYVSANPVYESARKFINSNIKMADRVSLVDYEVNSRGQSVLYFTRYAMGMKNTGVDIFRGMGPSIDPVGNRNTNGTLTEQFTPLVMGKQYIVVGKEGDYILYRTSDKEVKKVNHGSKFTAGEYYFVSFYSNNSVGVYEIDGIINSGLIQDSKKTDIIVDGKKQPAPGNISNEWLMFCSYNLYHYSNSSAWKPSNYGDIMGALNGRCLTSSYALDQNNGTSKNVKKTLANVSWRPNDLPLVVEAPSGYTYIEGANVNMGRAGQFSTDPTYPGSFAASCPIYQAPYQIASVTRANVNDPRSDLIKVTLNGRLRFGFGPDAQNLKGKVSENIETYLAANEKSSFRTDETAIIDYLLHIFTSRSCPRGTVGDVALDNDNFWGKQRPFGCCYPRFYFSKLIPYVSAGTVMYSDHYKQMEFYLRAMANGFIDNDTEMSVSEIEEMISQGLTGIDTPGGYDSAVGDYLFENLMKKSYNSSTESYSVISPNMTARQ